jgi:hypothetical protein
LSPAYIVHEIVSWRKLLSHLMPLACSFDFARPGKSIAARMGDDRDNDQQLDQCESSRVFSRQWFLACIHCRPAPSGDTKVPGGLLPARD